MAAVPSVPQFRTPEELADAYTFYKNMVRDQGGIKRYPPNVQEAFRYLDHNPPVQAALDSILAERNKRIERGENMPRMYADGNSTFTGTERQHKKYELEKAMREQMPFFGSNLLGAFGLYLGQQLYTDPAQIKNFAQMFANLGECGLGLGEMAGEGHENTELFSDGPRLHPREKAPREGETPLDSTPGAKTYRSEGGDEDEDNNAPEPAHGGNDEHGEKGGHGDVQDGPSGPAPQYPEGPFDMGVPLGVSEASFTENGAPGDEASPALDPEQIQDPLYADDANLPGETFDPGVEMNPGDVPLEGAVADGLYSPIEADGLISPAAIDVNNFGVDLSGADLAQAPSLNLDPQFFDAGGNGVDLGGVHPDHPAGGNDANFVNDPAAGDFGLQNPWNDAGLDGQVWAPQGPEY
jgi:hypothetical protein